MKIQSASIFILNYNGQTLLPECLPGILNAASHSRRRVKVVVIDNHSTDGSAVLMETIFPKTPFIRARANRFLSSFNEFVERDDADAVVLMNNDIKVEPNFLDPLLDVFESHEDAFFTGSLCWDFDKVRYEGGLSMLDRRAGLWGTRSVLPPKLRPESGGYWLTASIGASLTIRRDRFLELGGYDDLYLPGILEDLDLCYRGWRKGWKGYFVPESVIYHKGQASFAPAFGSARIRRMASRNTCFFVWKNIDDPGLRFLDLLWTPARIVYALFKNDTAFIAGILDAWKKYAHVCRIKKSRRSESIVSDRAILKLFQQQKKTFSYLEKRA